MPTAVSPCKRLLILCPFPQGVAAGQRLKYEQYFEDWRTAGYTIEVSSFMDDTLWRVAYVQGRTIEKIAGVLRGHLRRVRDMFRIPSYDLVYVFMYVTPVGTTLFERLTRRLAKHLLFDVEDNVLVGQDGSSQSHANPILRWVKGPGKARYLIRKADHVITSSPFLNDRCLAINERRSCTYITSSVDVGRYVLSHRYSNEHRVTIGWTGTFSSRPFLDLLRTVFVRLAQIRPFKLLVIGNFDYELPGVDLEVVQWSKDREIQDLQRFDIGVYPLPMDDWVFGKSGLKAIQYMAMGLPCVATRVGMSPRVVVENETGFLVESEDEWIGALVDLIDDADLRRRFGLAGRALAEQLYSTEAVRTQYRAALDAAQTTAPALVSRTAPKGMIDERS